jgi:hypothetical protein
VKPVERGKGLPGPEEIGSSAIFCDFPLSERRIYNQPIYIRNGEDSREQDYSIMTRLYKIRTRMRKIKQALFSRLPKANFEQPQLCSFS